MQTESLNLKTTVAEREAGKAHIRELVQKCGELRQENKSMFLVNAKLKEKV